MNITQRLHRDLEILAELCPKSMAKFAPISPQISDPETLIAAAKERYFAAIEAGDLYHLTAAALGHGRLAELRQTAAENAENLLHDIVVEGFFCKMSISQVSPLPATYSSARCYAREWDPARMALVPYLKFILRPVTTKIRRRAVKQTWGISVVDPQKFGECEHLQKTAAWANIA